VVKPNDMQSIIFSLESSLYDYSINLIYSNRAVTDYYIKVFQVLWFSGGIEDTVLCCYTIYRTNILSYCRSVAFECKLDGCRFEAA